MAIRSSVTVMDPSLKAVLSSVDEGRAPMPNQGMKAIAAICGEAAGLMKGAMVSGHTGLGNIVSGAPVMYPAAQSISKVNGAALAGLAAVAVAGLASSKGDKDGKKLGGAKGSLPETSKEPTKSPSMDKKEEKQPTKPPTDPKTYSGFEDDATYSGKGTKITLGGDYDEKPYEIPPIVIKAEPKKPSSVATIDPVTVTGD